MIYHGYENGYRTLGRQSLLEPVEWTDDGWFRALGGDLSRPLPKPKGGRAGPAGHALSDDFKRERFRNGFDDWLDGTWFGAFGQRHPTFHAFSLFETQAEFSLKQTRVLATTN